jgi:hypothetical protein
VFFELFFVSRISSSIQFNKKGTNWATLPLRRPTQQLNHRTLNLNSSDLLLRHLHHSPTMFKIRTSKHRHVYCDPPKTEVRLSALCSIVGMATRVGLLSNDVWAVAIGLAVVLLLLALFADGRRFWMISAFEI